MFAEGQKEDFVKKAKLFFSRHFMELQNREELQAITVKRFSDKKKGITEVRALKVRSDLSNQDSGPAFDDADIQVKAQEEFELMKKLCEVLYEQKRFPELQRVTFSALGSHVFNKHPEIVKVRTKAFEGLRNSHV